MKVAIIYATNSGSTYWISNLLRDVLAKKHQVLLLRAEDATTADLQAADALLFGSASWNTNEMEGMPLPAMQALFMRLGDVDFSKKQCAVFGAGDTSYTHFCGAVDRIESAITALGGKFIFPPLRIDAYYYDELANRERVTKWAEQIVRHLKA